jgi:hypothetical protein
VSLAVAAAVLAALNWVPFRVLNGVDYARNFFPGSCDPDNARLRVIQADPVIRYSPAGVAGAIGSIPFSTPAHSDVLGSCVGATVEVSYRSGDLLQTYYKLVETAKANGWGSPRGPNFQPGLATPTTFYSKNERGGWEVVLGVGQVEGYQEVYVRLSAQPVAEKPG